MHKVEQLRRQRLEETTRPFLARGSSLKRCNTCQLGADYCICQQLVGAQSHCDILLLIHRNELLKPSNSGRLIADTLPNNTHAFLWSRTEPNPELLALLADPKRQFLLVFPPQDGDPREKFSSQQAKEKMASEWQGKKITLLLLDGTWKQARKMYGKSDYLNDIPCLTLCEQDIKDSAGQYGLRQAHAPSLSSTCEAAAIALSAIGEKSAGRQTLKNFTTFNQAYIACRGNIRPKKISS